MRRVRVLSWAVCAALLAGCSGGGGWFGGAPGPDPVRALLTPTGPKSFSGIIDFTSDPPGAQATTSLGGLGCQTPCSLEVTAEAPFTVTFARQDYAPSTVSVQIQPGQQGVTVLLLRCIGRADPLVDKFGHAHLAGGGT